MKLLSWLFPRKPQPVEAPATYFGDLPLAEAAKAVGIPARFTDDEMEHMKTEMPGLYEYITKLREAKRRASQQHCEPR